MPRNIVVTDETGKIYGTTWPKRARGLVSRGRARFISEKIICLACPPGKEHLEDIPMAEEIKKAGQNIDIEYILRQIELVRLDNEHIKSTIDALKDSTSDQSAALAKLVHEKEETSRVILDFYRKIYEDMNQKAHAMKVLEKIAENEHDLPVGEITNLMYRLLDIDKIK